MNSEYLLSMVIGFVLVFAGALVAYKGRKKIIQL